jgi:CRP-like cAMP-binding protein
LLVRKFDDHVHLDAADKAAITDLPFTMRGSSAGRFIVREGDVPSGCAVIVEGFAARHKLVQTGARQIVSIHIPGDALDLQHLFLDCADHSVTALTDVTLATIPRLALQELAMARPAIAHAVAISNQIEASIFREWIVNVGRRDAKTRLAHLLCEFAIRLTQRGLASDEGFALPMTQEQIGDATGLTSVHVNRTLRLLEEEGWIERDKRAVRFSNWDRMRSMAGFNPLYLHLGRQAAAARA